MKILDDPQNRKMVYPLSVDVYHEAGRRRMIQEEVELLEGVIFKKLPKSPLHEWLVEYLRLALEKACVGRFFVAKERPITCARSEPEPDLAVFSGAWTDYRQHHPATAELVIEVAINTQPRDRSKALIYAEAGVKEYWLVEPESRRITLFTRPAPGGYETSNSATAVGIVTSTVFPAFSVDLAGIFA